MWSRIPLNGNLSECYENLNDVTRKEQRMERMTTVGMRMKKYRKVGGGDK